MKFYRRFFFAALSIPLHQAYAIDTTTLLDCAAIVQNAQRLACYDRLSDQLRQESAAGSPAETTVPPVPPDNVIAAKPARASDNDDDDRVGSNLSRHYELDQADKDGLFKFRLHYPTYLLLAQYNSSPNIQPYKPLLEALPGQQDINKTELKFQLSFKLKMMENLFNDRADLWFGYTQQSFWQAYNSSNSSPFRESNYAPELMLVFPTNYSFLGMQGKFLNLGLIHQSNGQGLSLSRSWNRVYAQLGFERGDFSMLVRGWHRIKEAAESDDNPDITDYMGHGDLIASYRFKGHEVYGVLRHNFKTGRGATELGYAFPLKKRVKGFVRLFSGYGESLIDYNDYQNLIGLGVYINY